MLHIKFIGDNSLISSIMSGDLHPWSWLIHPPSLYIVDLACTVGDNGDFSHDITEQELDDHDIALSAMERWDVLPCRIKKKGKLVTVEGEVRGIKEVPLAFHIKHEIS